MNDTHWSKLGTMSENHGEKRGENRPIKFHMLKLSALCRVLQLFSFIAVCFLFSSHSTHFGVEKGISSSFSSWWKSVRQYGPRFAF